MRFYTNPTRGTNTVVELQRQTDRYEVYFDGNRCYMITLDRGTALGKICWITLRLPPGATYKSWEDVTNMRKKGNIWLIHAETAEWMRDQVDSL